MKTKITAIVFMLILTALLPLIAVKCSEGSRLKQAISTADSAESADAQTDSDSILCALVAAEYKDSYSDEALKAIAIIINTNYKLKPDSYDKSDMVFKDNADESTKKAYSKIERAVNSIKEKTLCINNKAFYIPYSESSNGSTCKSSKYSYIQAVASPWDCYLDSYNEQTQCIGVSLEGINYLCSKGASAQEALYWYLPQFTIK